MEQISALENLINSDYNNIAGMVVLKNNEQAYEQYFNNCNKTSTLHIASVTKSIMSILIGIAIDQGHIKSIDQKLSDFFSDCKNIGTVTLKDLLTMKIAFKELEDLYIKYFTSNNWLKFTLDLLEPQDSLDQFIYSPLVGLDILSGIIVKTTGQTVLAFATKYLFSPLKIQVKDNLTFTSEQEQQAFMEATDLSGWVTDLQGLNAAGWGLTLSAQDMAKLGQLYLNEGQWQDKQIVSSSWIKESISKHNYWQEQNLGYGYLWWIDQSSFFAMGDGGNVIYVNPSNNLVIAIVSQFRPDVNDRIDFIKNYVEPVFAGESNG